MGNVPKLPSGFPATVAAETLGAGAGFTPTRLSESSFRPIFAGADM